MPHIPVDKDLQTSTIALCVLFFMVLCTIVAVIVRGCIRKRKERQSVVLEKSPVVVTSATHTGPTVAAAPLPQSYYHNNGLYTTQYGRPNPPGTVTVQMPMPMPMPQPGAQPPPMGIQTHGVAYPGMMQPGAGAACMNPPTYDMAMASPPAPGYEKQAPYNPGYTGQ